MAILLINKGGSIPELIGLSTDVKPTVPVPVGSMFTESDTGMEFKFDGTNWFPLVKQTTATGSSPVTKGVATGGSPTTIIDTTKNFEANIFAHKLAKVTISDVSYLRNILSNTGNTITISALQSAVAARAVIGEVGGGQVTVVCVTEGIVGNPYTVSIIAAPGTDDALSASFSGTALTVYLGKTDDALDDAKNTGTLVAAAIDTVPEFTATMTGAGGVVAVTVDPISFSGGVDAIGVSAGTSYEIVDFNARSTPIAESISNADGTRSVYVQASMGDEENFVNALATSGFMLQYNPVTGKWQRFTGEVKATLTGSLALLKTLQANAVLVGNGTPYTPTSPETLTFVITGTSTSRTIVFEIADPIAGVYQSFAIATKLGDTTYTPVASTTEGSTALPVTYEVDIPANYSFRTRISVAPVGGDVDISGWTVAQ